MFPTKNQQPSLRRGLSLVEVMIAMVMTLIVLGAMMAAFAYGSAEMQKGRAAIELNNRLINAEEQLRRDLDRITVDLKPYQQLPGMPSGYVEIADGPGVDGDYDGPLVDGDGDGVLISEESVFGDRDDYISFTVRSDGRPFRGRLNGAIIESHLAEVVWMVVPDPRTADANDRILIRRQLLVLPSALVNSGANYATYLAENDISVRRTTTGLVPNTLADLAVRGNRFAHTNAAATSPQNSLIDTATLLTMYNQANFNETHVVASTLAAFDIQVFDPTASVRVITDAGGVISDVLNPSDLGTLNGVGAVTDLSGSYLDLGKGVPGGLGVFGDNAAGGYVTGVYDTGTSLYNRQGANNRASNGVDDAVGGGMPNGIVDDVNEQFAIAPYNAPIRGLQFRIRVFETASKQARQLSVQKSFVPES